MISLCMTPEATNDARFYPELEIPFSDKTWALSYSQNKMLLVDNDFVRLRDFWNITTRNHATLYNYVSLMQFSTVLLWTSSFLKNEIVPSPSFLFFFEPSTRLKIKKNRQHTAYSIDITQEKLYPFHGCLMVKVSW